MFPKPKRIKDRKLLDEVKNQACVCCGSRVAVDPDHILSRGAGGDDSPNNVWPLCRKHHTEKHSIGLRRLAAKWPQAKQELYARGFHDVVADADEILEGQLGLPIK